MAQHADDLLPFAVLDMAGDIVDVEGLKAVTGAQFQHIIKALTQTNAEGRFRIIRVFLQHAFACQKSAQILDQFLFVFLQWL